MKKHVKIYMTAVGYSPGEWMPCEVSAMEKENCMGNGTAVDVHHIVARGMGGSDDKDSAANLMGLCRECHEGYGDKSQYDDWLQLVHRRFILTYAK